MPILSNFARGADKVIREGDEDAVAAPNLIQRVFNTITDPRDRQLLQLLRTGERKTAAYAEILGIQDHNAMEQRKIVKQHKDRLKKQLERLGVKLREQASQ